MAAAFFACGSSVDRTTIGAADGGAGSDGGSAFSNSGSGDSGSIVGSGGDAATDDGCSEEAKLVYVLSLEGDLYSFAPADKKFTKIGALNCGSGLVPISMAVDRNAVAWVNLRPSSGIDPDILFKVDTKTLKCEASKVQGTMGGMGFSLNAGTKDQETLFVAGDGSSGLGSEGLNKVNFTTESLELVTDFPEPSDLELTGTGDGKLYGFLVDETDSLPLAVAQVDKTTAAFSGRFDLPQVEQPQAPMFAFSFWGGDFYIYTATSTSASKSTNVTRYRPSDSSVDTKYMTNIGFHIVGAGVSTCAPTAPPK